MIISDINRGIKKNKSRKRIGRGIGSGHGKTAGRGHKGAGSRNGNSTRVTFTGGNMPLVQRTQLPPGELSGTQSDATEVGGNGNGIVAVPPNPLLAPPTPVPPEPAPSGSRLGTGFELEPTGPPPCP